MTRVVRVVILEHLRIGDYGEITRGAVGGGRGAVGRYLLGLLQNPVYAEFSLKATVG
jgi:hypothetical protein